MVQLHIHVKSIRHLLEKLPTKNGWFNNPTNSPDLAYPMEDFGGFINIELKE